MEEEDFKNQIVIDLTTAGKAIFYNWIAGFKNRPSTKNVWLRLTTLQYVVFFEMLRMFFNCIGVGNEDWSNGFVRYKPDLTDNLYMNLILDAASNLSNFPSTVQDCWLSGKYDERGYYYAQTSSTVSKVKTTYREKSMRLFSSLFCRPCFTSGDAKEADHACNRPNCYYPRHGRNVTSIENKSHCKFGCQHYCPHVPKCVWTIPDGSACLHRNNPDVAFQKSECDCPSSCFSVDCEGGNPNNK